MPELKPHKLEQPPFTPEVGPRIEQQVTPQPPPREQTGEPAVGAPAPVPTPPPRAPAASPQLTKQVERVLEEDMGELYRSLTPEQQVVFKRRGEETASRISQLLGHVKLKVREVLKLIREWLMTVPGVSRYFVEQEAKLKADKLLKLRE